MDIWFRETKASRDGHRELTNTANVLLRVAVFGIDSKCESFNGGFQERFKSIVSFNKFAFELLLAEHQHPDGRSDNYEWQYDLIASSGHVQSDADGGDDGSASKVPGKGGVEVFEDGEKA